MSISLSSDINMVKSHLDTQNANAAKASDLQGRLSALSKNPKGASDEELMEVCKSFESYLVEQVMKKTKEAIAPSEEDENTYMQMFGDNLYQAYSDQIAESGTLGLSQQLFEAMKRDYGVNSVKNSITDVSGANEA